MSKKKNIGQSHLSRRGVLKYAVSGLIAGMVGPALFRVPLASAAGPSMEFKNALTIYYSRTGNTRIMADFVQELTSSDIVQIETVNAYPSEYRETTKVAKEELNSGYNPPLTTKVENMDAYDVVFVGSPCWWGTIAPPVISFLSEYNFSGKTVVPFMTHKGSRLGRTMDHVSELCPASTIMQGLALWGGSVSSNRSNVARWLRGLDRV